MSESRGALGGVHLYLTKMRLFSHNARMVLAYSAFTGLAFGVFRLLFNFYVLSLGGYDELFLGNLTSAQSLAGLLMAIPAAYIAERFSQKRIMMISGWVSAFAFAGLVLLPYRGFLITFSFVMGISTAIRQVTAAPFLMRNTSQEERQWVFSFNFGMMTLAQFVGNQVGGYLPTWLGRLAQVGPTDTFAYKLALGSMMLISVLAISPLFFIRPLAQTQSDIDRASVTFKHFVGGIRRHGGALFKLILPQVLIGLGAGLMMPFMNVYFRNVLERDDIAIGTLFGIGAFGMAVAQFLGPPLADRRGKINAVIMAQAGSIPFLMSFGVVAWIVYKTEGQANMTVLFLIAAVAYLFRLALMNMGNPIYTTFILEQLDEEVQAVAIGLNAVAFRFGWAVMPSLSGWLQAEYNLIGFTVIFMLVSGLYLLGILSERIFFRDAIRAGGTTKLEQ